jgi:hypothetical protein
MLFVPNTARDSFCARIVFAASKTFCRGRVSLVSVMMSVQGDDEGIMGASYLVLNPEKAA